MTYYKTLRFQPCPMKNFFLTCSLLFGVGTSAVSSYWGAIDMYQLDKAFRAGDNHAELRHRINVFADGTWILLGVLISVTSVCGIHKPHRDT
jgi:hypothetical protein